MYINSRKSILLFVLISLIVVGCQKTNLEKTDLDWSVNEDRTIVSGILGCDCLEVDVEMLVTDENTGENHVSTFIAIVGIRFERLVGIESDFISIDLSITEVR